MSTEAQEIPTTPEPTPLETQEPEPEQTTEVEQPAEVEETVEEETKEAGEDEEGTEETAPEEETEEAVEEKEEEEEKDEADEEEGKEEGKEEDEEEVKEDEGQEEKEGEEEEEKEDEVEEDSGEEEAEKEEKKEEGEQVADDKEDEGEAEETQEPEDPEPEITSIRQCLSISETDSIKFGNVFPGQIKEQKFMIENESGKKLTLKVKVDCLNKEFDELDEYVFSIRKPPQYDYNDTYYVMMSPKDFITFHVAIKVPKLRTPKVLKGKIVVTDQNMKDKFETKIVANTTLPMIECPKMLFVKEIGIDVVMFNLKYLRKQDFRFPVKVKAPKGHKFTCEVEIIEEQSDQDYFMFKVIPSIIGLADTNGTSQTFNIIARATDKFESGGKQGMRDIRKVLILKIANSSLIFSFPMLFKYKKK